MTSSSAPPPARAERRPLPSPGTRLVVTMDGLDDEGRARALVGDDEESGFELAVRGALPGDVGEVVVERVWAKRRLLQARLVELREPGPARTERRCARGPACAGCPLEGALPSVKLGFKRARLEIALVDAGLESLLPCIDDVVAPRFGYHRRQKSKLVLGRAGPSAREGLLLGLYRPHSHELDPAEDCPYQRPELSAAFTAVRRVLEETGVVPCPPSPKGAKAVLARSFEEGVGVVLVVAAPLADSVWSRLCALVDDGALAQLTERVDEGTGNSLLGGSVERTRGPAELTPLEGGAPSTVDAFCQPDPFLARRLYRDVAGWAVAGGTGGWFLDAYAGTGGFARALLAAGATRVVAVERAPPSLQALGLLDVEVVADEVGAALPGLAGRPPPTAVVADPPRKGLGPDAIGLAALGARRLALVSCDPDAMARDLVELCRLGYRVERIVPWDLFSGTAQVEAVSLLVREGSAA